MTITEAGPRWSPPVSSRSAPLSHAQRRVWFLSRFGSGDALHAFTLRLRGAVDVGALRTALADVVARHEVLRTVFPDAEQRVLDAVPELRLAPYADGAVEAAAGSPFDLSVDPPLRTWLFEVAPDEHVLLVVVHRIACDDRSTGLLLAGLAEAYDVRLRGLTPDWEPLPVQYADHVARQLTSLGEEDDPDSAFSRQLAHWSGALAGLPVELALPTDRPRPAVPSGGCGQVPVLVSAATSSRLAALARDTGTTTFTALQAAVAVVLAKVGAGEDIPLGVAVAGDEELIGLFANTVVLRTDVSGDPSFRELLARVRLLDLSAFDNADVPFDRVVEVLDPVRSPARHPLFQVMLVLRDNSDGDVGFPGSDAAATPVGPRSSRFDLAVTLRERPNGLTGLIEYATDLFDPATAERLAGRFTAVLDQVAASPDAPIGTIDVLLPGEHRTRPGQDRRVPSPARR